MINTIGDVQGRARKRRQGLADSKWSDLARASAFRLVLLLARDAENLARDQRRILTLQPPARPVRVGRLQAATLEHPVRIVWQVLLLEPQKSDTAREAENVSRKLGDGDAVDTVIPKIGYRVAIVQHPVVGSEIFRDVRSQLRGDCLKHLGGEAPWPAPSSSCSPSVIRRRWPPCVRGSRPRVRSWCSPRNLPAGLTPAIHRERPWPSHGPSGAARSRNRGSTLLLRARDSIPRRRQTPLTGTRPARGGIAEREVPSDFRSGFACS